MLYDIKKKRTSVHDAVAVWARLHGRLTEKDHLERGAIILSDDIGHKTKNDLYMTFSGNKMNNLFGFIKGTLLALAANQRSFAYLFLE